MDTLPIKLNLPKSFFEEENRDGYVVSSKMKILWAVLLDLLKELMDVCDRNNICYYACGGTMLGAIRHKGMIPWDDDIDIMMPREDYEKLCAIAPREFADPYFFQTENTDHGCLRGHAQLRNCKTTGILSSEKGKFSFNQGMFLDIFPLDNLPDSPEERSSYFANIQSCRAKMVEIREYDYPYEVRFQMNLFKFVKKLVKNILYRTLLKDKNRLRSAYENFEKAITAYNDKDTNDVVLSPLNMERYSWNKKDFAGSPIRVPFEMFDIPVPSGYLNMLNRTYGNWQKFVVGGSVHGDLIFDGTRPYKESLAQLKQERMKGKCFLFKKFDG